MKLAVALLAGHSGGHLFPALAFAETLRARHPGARISLITSVKGRPFAESMPAGIFDATFFLNEFPLPSGISLRTLAFLLKFARSFVESFRILSRLKPDLCVGFGSYVSYPGMLLAAWGRVPTMIHEQNRVAGIATRKLARHVRTVAVTFPETRGLEGVKPRFTGLPLRSELVRSASAKLEKAKPLFRILIVGGSQGSQRLNDAILRTFSLLAPEELRNLAVTHITGAGDYERIRGAYEKMNFQFEIHPFYTRMQDLYTQADMAVTRAGANTLFELSLFGIPAVVVPYPHAGGHQMDNAEYFASRDAVIVREEGRLTPEWLAGEIRQLRDDAGSRVRLSTHLLEMSPAGAAGRLADLAGELVRKS